MCKSTISPGDNLPQLPQEFSERGKYSHNVPNFHGLIESSAALPAGQLADDIIHVSDSVLPLSMSLPLDVMMIRLDPTIGKNLRPLKVIFPSKTVPLHFRSSIPIFNYYDVIILTETWLSSNVLNSSLMAIVEIYN